MTCSSSPSSLPSWWWQLSGLIGVPAAYALAQQDLPGKKLVMLSIPAAVAGSADHLRYPNGDGALPDRLRRARSSGVVLANLVPTVPFGLLGDDPIHQADRHQDRELSACF